MISVNWWAILVCAIASMVVGWLWYGPLFGKAWMNTMGMGSTPDDMKKAMQKSAGPGYAVMFVGALVMAYAMSKVLGHFNAVGLHEALKVAAEIWLGFVATVFLGGVYFEKKGWKHYFITAGYQLVNMLVYAVILSYWK